ncbi:MAG: hypothetical protein QXF25_00770 [Candidatus Pacearchaeota archaeon]
MTRSKRVILEGKVEDLDFVSSYFNFVAGLTDPKFFRTSIVFSARKNLESKVRQSLAILLEKPQESGIIQKDKPYRVIIASFSDFNPECSSYDLKNNEGPETIVYKHLIEMIKYQPVSGIVYKGHIYYRTNLNLREISLNGFLLNFLKFLDKQSQSKLRPDFEIVAASRLESLFKDKQTPVPGEIKAVNNNSLKESSDKNSNELKLKNQKIN